MCVCVYVCVGRHMCVYESRNSYLTELRQQKLEFKKSEDTGICETDFKKEDNYTKNSRNSLRDPLSLCWFLEYACER